MTDLAPTPSTAPALPEQGDSNALDRTEALSQQLSVMAGLLDLAEKVARTPFGASQGNRTENVFAAMMKGHEVGLQPMQALESVDVIQGKPTLKPEVMRALIRQQGHDYEVVEMTDQRCVMLAHRKNWPADKWTRWEFTVDEARAMGLLSKDNWKKQQAVMMFARCTSKMGRGEFADVLKGLSYTPEEMEFITVESRPVATPPEVQEALASAPQAHTQSDAPAPTHQAVSELQSLYRELNPSQVNDLKAWWKRQEDFPMEGKWPGGLMRQLNDAQRQMLIAECKRIAQATHSQDDEAIEAEVVEDAPASASPAQPHSPTPPADGDHVAELESVLDGYGVATAKRLPLVERITGNGFTSLSGLSKNEADDVRAFLDDLKPAARSKYINEAG